LLTLREEHMLKVLRIFEPKRIEVTGEWWKLHNQELNPLPVQFKSLLHGQEGCVFSSGHLNIRTCQYVWLRLARQVTFKSSTFWYFRAGKGLMIRAAHRIWCGW
jgi:hypothetical protein